jgi:hypothetical protein
VKFAWDATEWRGLLQAVRVGEEAMLHRTRRWTGGSRAGGPGGRQEAPGEAADTWAVLVLRRLAESIGRALQDHIGDVVIQVADSRVEFVGFATAAAVAALDRRSADPTWSAARQTLARFREQFAAVAGADT